MFGATPAGCFLVILLLSLWSGATDASVGTLVQVVDDHPRAQRNALVLHDLSAQLHVHLFRLDAHYQPLS